MRCWGGIGEHFAWEFDLDIPAWTEDDIRFLSEPYFFKYASAHPETWNEVMAATPMAYARRNLFLGNEPFSRPGKYTDMRLSHRLWEFLDRARSMEPRVLIPARWRRLEAISDHAQAIVDTRFHNALDRIPPRWKFHDCYYLAMAINEFKLRSGSNGKSIANALLDSIEVAQYEECLVEMRSVNDCATPCFHQGWRNIEKAADMAQRFIENNFKEIIRHRRPRKSGVIHDSSYLSWAVLTLKSKCGPSGLDAVMQLADVIESCGWVKWKN
jgi:hypothetical protein